jgi:hypothetical protein
VNSFEISQRPSNMAKDHIIYEKKKPKACQNILLDPLMREKSINFMGIT